MGSASNTRIVFEPKILSFGAIEQSEKVVFDYVRNCGYMHLKSLPMCWCALSRLFDKNKYDFPVSLFTVYRYSFVAVSRIPTQRHHQQLVYEI